MNGRHAGVTGKGNTDGSMCTFSSNASAKNAPMLMFQSLYNQQRTRASLPAHALRILRS